MSRIVHVHQLDVFTRTPFTGNPAAVVLGAEGLPDSTRRAIAREMNLSETAFVEAPDGEGHVPVRFFTPSREVPVCGHATLAAHVARARALGLERGVVGQRAPGGTWTVRWEERGGGMYATMDQGAATLGEPLGPAAVAEAAAALGAPSGSLRVGWPLLVASTGHPKLLVPLAHPSELAALHPDPERLLAAGERLGVEGWFVFAEALDPDAAPAVRARMFGPALGVPEDPVNGSGHGPLGAYLASRDAAWRRRAGRGFWSAMGDHLGRPGRVHVRLRGDGHVEVGGFVTPVFETTLRLGGDAAVPGVERGAGDPSQADSPATAAIRRAASPAPSTRGAAG